MNAIETKNGNLLVNTGSICFYTDKDFSEIKKTVTHEEYHWAVDTWDSDEFRLFNRDIKQLISDYEKKEALKRVNTTFSCMWLHTEKKIKLFNKIFKEEKKKTSKIKETKDGKNFETEDFVCRISIKYRHGISHYAYIYLTPKKLKAAMKLKSTYLAHVD